MTLRDDLMMQIGGKAVEAAAETIFAYNEVIPIADLPVVQEASDGCLEIDGRHFDVGESSRSSRERAYDQLALARHQEARASDRDVETLARQLRETYRAANGYSTAPWANLKPERQAAWRAVARFAIEHGSKAVQ